MDLSQLNKIFKALGDSVRLEIFQMLQGGKLCACKIQQAFNITQPTLSHHMRVLTECDLVIAEKQGKWVYYHLNCNTLKALSNFIDNARCLCGNKKDIECNCNN